MYIVYSKDNCTQCVMVENLLKMKGKEYKVRKLDKDYTRDDLEQIFAVLGLEFPRSFPMLFKEQNYIGGLNEVKLLAAKGEL